MTHEDHVERIATFLAVGLPKQDRGIYDEIEPFAGGGEADDGAWGYYVPKEVSDNLGKNPAGMAIVGLNYLWPNQRLDISCWTWDDQKLGDDEVRVTRFRQVPDAAVRGRASFQSGPKIELRHRFIGTDGKPRDGGSEFAVWRAGKWIGMTPAPIHRTDLWRSSDGVPLSRIIAGMGRMSGMSIVAQHNRPMHWAVMLGFDGSPSVHFQTTPTGAREVFRLRDIPNGKSRRTALRHWVREHWRKKHDDPADESKVREHLRGATSFVWNGLRCSVRPAQEDLDRHKPSGAVG